MAEHISDSCKLLDDVCFINNKQTFHFVLFFLFSLHRRNTSNSFSVVFCLDFQHRPLANWFCYFSHSRKLFNFLSNRIYKQTILRNRTKIYANNIDMKVITMGINQTNFQSQILTHDTEGKTFHKKK